LDKDDLVARIEDTIEALESTYFTDDDRVKVKNIRAEANKFSKELGKAVIEHKKRLTTHLDEERKEIVDKLTHMSDRLNDELVKFDQKIRTEKREDMVMAFEDAVFTLNSTNGNTAFLHDLTLAAIENTPTCPTVSTKSWSSSTRRFAPKSAKTWSWRSMTPYLP